MARLRRAGGRRPLAAVFLVAVPLLFIHKSYLPHASVGAVTIELADLGMLAIAVAALADGARRGFAPLRAAPLVWGATALLLALVLASVAWGAAREPEYPAGTHVVTALKFCEYAALALAVPLLVRDRRELELLLWSVAGWSAVASTVGLVQFLGWRIFRTSPAFEREHSFLGPTNFAALSGLALLLALSALAFGGGAAGPRALVRVAGAAGALGTALAATVAQLLGLAVAVAALLGLALLRRRLDLRRAAGVLAVVGVAAAVALVLRAGDLTQFGRFLGLRHEERATREDVQTYSQHTLLAYVGWKIFLREPALGVGWQGSGEPYAFRPVLPDARRRFASVSPLAFPSTQHPWGVQMAYVQILADVGVLGGIAWIGLLAAGVATAVRRLVRGPPQAQPALLGLLWTLLAAALWTTVGVVSGDPLDAVHWLALGAAAAPVLSSA